MKNFNKKILKFLIMLGIFVSTFPKTMAAANVSVSGPGSVTVGESVTVTISTGNNTFNGKVSVSGAASGSKTMPLYSGQSDSITVTANSVGTIYFKFEGQVTSMDDVGSFKDRTFTHNVTVKDKPTNKPSNPTPVPTPSETRQETAEEKAEREKREAEARLAERKKNPLIQDIKILSESDRLKGEEIVTLETNRERFDYSATLPRNIDKFKLDLTPVDKDVKLTYDQMYQLDANHDKVEIMVKAVQDEVSQDFKITVSRHKESEVTFKHEDISVTLLNDKLIDKALKEYGIEKHLFDEKKDHTFYYYQYEDYKFALTFDKENVAHWVFLDDKGQMLEEFVLVIDQHDRPRFLVNVDLEDSPTLQGNRYEQKEVFLPKSITSLDESINFYNVVNAWDFDENGIITHEYVHVESKDTASTEEVISKQESPYKLVYVGKDAMVESAFVAFDEVNQDMMYLAGALFALLVVLLIVFVIYWRSTSKKINQLITRKSL